MVIELPPDGLGDRPHATAPVPRLDLELTRDDRLALEPVVVKMRELAMDNVGVGGFDCPACTQLVHIYLKPFSMHAARLLLLLFCEYDATKEFSLRNDGNRLWGRRPLPVDIWLFGPWGLTEFYTETVEHTDREGALHLVEEQVPGYYYISDYGRRFIRGELEIPSHASSYNGRVLRLYDDHGYDIYQAVGREFDLEELQATASADRMKVLLAGREVKRPRRIRR
jgi:hypothetical protein